MRVADNMNYNQVVQNINKNRKESSELNNQAATMKRLTKPSDDPAGNARVLAARTDIAAYQQYEKSLGYAKSFLEFSEQSLAELGDLLIRMKELAISQASEAGANATTRRAAAAEVEQAYQQTLQIANRKMGDRYLFGGFKTTETPFVGAADYRGDDGELMIEIDKGSYVPMNIPGSKVFLGKGFAVRTLVDLNEGVPKDVNELETLQAAIDEDKREKASSSGQVPSAEPRSRSNGVQKDVEIRGPSSLASYSHRASTSKDGENVFSVIRSFHTGLATNDTGTIQNILERIDDALEQVVMARSQVGSRVMTLNNTMESLSRQTLDSKTLASSVEDANAFELFSDISKNETTLKASMESSRRLISPSLLDFLR